jgi:hypothetical protein
MDFITPRSRPYLAQDQELPARRAAHENRKDPGDPRSTFLSRRRQDAPAGAAARVKRLLAEYRSPKLDPGIEEEFVDFVQRRKVERPDQWR